MFIPSLLLFSLLLVTSSASDQVEDFCVADLSQFDTPSGFPCKHLTDLTANDFLFSLAVPKPMNKTFSYSLTPATALDFPGVNGLRLSLGRVDIAPGGIFPMHTHPRGNELFTVISGTVIVTFISSFNIVYSKQLHKWDIFVFPQGLRHFLINPGPVPAVGLASLSSSRPGIQFTQDFPLIGNFLASQVVRDDSHVD